MTFLEKYSRNSFIATLIKFSVFTLINVLFLILLLYLDNNYIINETWISVLAIPIGLINFATLVVSLNGLRKLNWYSLTFAIFSIVNFMVYIKISLNMYSQSGAILN